MPAHAPLAYAQSVRLFLLLCLGLLLLVPPTYAQTPPAASTTDRHHPFVEHAERRYRQYLAAENQGDAAAYKEVRTRQAYQMTMDQRTKMGKPPSALAQGPTLEFAAFMIHWDDGAWRIGWVAQSSGPATRSSGDKRSADELLGDPRLALE